MTDSEKLNKIQTLSFKKNFEGGLTSIEKKEYKELLDWLCKPLDPNKYDIGLIYSTLK